MSTTADDTLIAPVPEWFNISFLCISCTFKQWWRGSLKYGLTRNWMVRPLRLPCQAVSMPGSLSGQSIDVLTPIALFILCDQVMRGWWAMVGKEQLGWKSLEDNSSHDIVSLYPVAFTGL